MWKDEATAADILLAAQDIQRFTAGMRDRCIHRYNEIKPEAVWEVVSVDAPAMERYLKGIVRPPPEAK